MPMTMMNMIQAKGAGVSHVHIGKHLIGNIGFHWSKAERSARNEALAPGQATVKQRHPAEGTDHVDHQGEKDGRRTHRDGDRDKPVDRTSPVDAGGLVEFLWEQPASRPA